MRAAAVRALQSMVDPRVDGLIAGRLLTDDATEVRTAAVDAAKQREASDTLTNAAMQTALQATDAVVRYHAVELLLQWMHQRPDLRAFLTGIEANDPEPRVRERVHADSEGGPSQNQQPLPL